MKPFKTMDELKDCLVKYVSTDMLLGVIWTGRGQNSNYYWRWSGYVEIERLTELFPDVRERLAAVKFSDDDKNIYAYQLEKWYNVDFREARKQVWARFEAKLKEAEELFRK